MARIVHKTYYACKLSHNHNTEAEADECDRQHVFEDFISNIGDNPDFESVSSEYEDFDTDDYEVHTEPEDTTDPDRVQLVTISSRGKVYLVEVWRRKEQEAKNES